VSSRWISRLVTVVIVTVGLGGGWLLLRKKVGRPTVPGERMTYAVFRDASGLPTKSRVLIAGVQVGEITHLAIEGGLARIDMRLSDDVVLWDDAYVMKSGSLAFGDSHVEIFPGGAEDPSKGDGGHRRLRPGEPIPRVIEGDSTDRFLKTVDRTLPLVDDALNGMDGFIARARRYFDGNGLARIDDADKRLSQITLDAPVQRVGRAVTAFDDWTRTTLATTQDLGPEVRDTLDGDTARARRATDDLKSAQATLHDKLSGFRTDMNDLDPYLADANAWLVRQGAGARIAANSDGKPTEVERSRIGKLIDDPTLGDRIADGTQAVADYTGDLDALRTVIGLRNEFVIGSQSLNSYLTVELSGRSDRFFVLELERGSIGKLADIEITDVPGGSYIRRTSITGGFRLSAQWGKRIGWFAYRFGLKESTFGIGADGEFLGGRLKLSADLYGENFSTVPRLKLETAVEVFRSIFLFGGIDDALAKHGELRIATWPVGALSPTDYRTLSYGRDYFFGFVFKLNEEDAARMLRIYGSFIGAFL
jgi:phospholipid/cholesterol/gamma-HCH transport system substrate-binding protein